MTRGAKNVTLWPARSASSSRGSRASAYLTPLAALGLMTIMLLAVPFHLKNISPG